MRATYSLASARSCARAHPASMPNASKIEATMTTPSTPTRNQGTLVLVEIPHLP